MNRLIDANKQLDKHIQDGIGDLDVETKKLEIMALIIVLRMRIAVQLDQLWHLDGDQHEQQSIIDISLEHTRMSATVQVVHEQKNPNYSELWEKIVTLYNKANAILATRQKN